MEHFTGNTLLDRSFLLSITLKGLDGLLEIAGAFLFLGNHPGRLNAFINALTFHLLSSGQVSRLTERLMDISHGIAGHTPYFVFLYLLSHGLAKVVLVTALWFNKLWAYPMMILLLVGFIAYQVYVMAHNFTVFLALLTIFDALVIWLTKEEYAKQKMRKRPRAEPVL